MPKSYAEQYRLVDAASLAGELGQSALALALELKDDTEPERSKRLANQLPAILHDSLEVIEVSSFDLVDDIRRRRTPPQTFTELNNLSLGLSEAEAGASRGVPKSTIKSWRKDIKAYMGTATRADTVAQAIQQGWVHIEPDNSSHKPLSWMEERVLTYAAAGWTTREISERFKLSDNTIDRHYEEIRMKLGARNLPHAVRRGFEVGIFKIGEPIQPSVETIDEMKLSFTSAAGHQITVRLDDPREIDLLQKMLIVGDGSLTARQAIEAEGSSQIGKMPHVGRTMLTLRQKLEAAAGEPVITKSYLRTDNGRVHVYRLTRELTLMMGDQTLFLPEYKTRLPNKSGRPPLKPATAKPKPKKPKAIEAEPKLPTETVIETAPAPPVPDFIPAEKLPDLTEALLKKLTARDNNEVFLNSGVRGAANAIARNAPPDYRTKLLLFLRYGNPSPGLVTVNRSGQFISAKQLQPYIPAHRGLDVISASLVSGLTPLAILQSEKKLIVDFKAEHPCLASLEDIVTAEIKLLEAVTQN